MTEFIRRLIKVYFMMANTFVDDDGTMVYSPTREILGKVNFAKSVYNQETGHLSISVQSLQPIEFITFTINVDTLEKVS